jgi:heat shock protein HslJ
MKRLVMLGCALLAITSVMMTGCGSSSQDGKLLEAQDWRATSIEYNTYSSADDITAKFADGKISGSTGLNQFNATYKLEPNRRITVTVGETGKAAGTPDQTLNEQAYLGALASAKSYAADGKSLTLFSATGLSVLSFEANVAPALVGTTWKMLAFNNGKGGLIAPATTSAVTIVFKSDGNMSGSAGLAGYHAKYAVSGSGIKLTSPLVSKEAGGPDLAVQDTAFLTALQKVASFAIAGDKLTLNDAAGGVAVQYQAQR